MKNHILIYGNKGAGKSSLISRLLEESTLRKTGFVTRRLDETREGFHPVYIHSVEEYYRVISKESDEIRRLYPGGIRGKKLEGLTYTEENLVAWCDGRRHEPNLYAFDVLGVSYIREGLGMTDTDKREKALLIMDEVGFLESRAEVFRDAVFEALESKMPLIMGVKAFPEAEFTQSILHHPNAVVFCITEENREELFEQLVPIVRSWE